MHRDCLRWVAVFLVACGLFAQGPASRQPLEFDVATIKPMDSKASGPMGGSMGSKGGPGSNDPGRIAYSLPLKRLILMAYDIPSGQLSGPDWLNGDKLQFSFDVTAKVPEGATKQQVPVMLQHLLAERFGMVVHHEMRDKPAYDLTVAKGGPKLKGTAYPNAKPVSNGTVDFSLDKNDFPILPKDAQVQARVDWVKNGSFRSSFRAISIAELALDLANILNRPSLSPPDLDGIPMRVFDKTGLTERYDFTLEYEGVAEDSTGPSIFNAVEKQLGLKLDKTKEPIDIVVIDRLEKVPTEN